MCESVTLGRWGDLKMKKVGVQSTINFAQRDQLWDTNPFSIQVISSAEGDTGFFFHVEKPAAKQVRSVDVEFKFVFQSFGSTLDLNQLEQVSMVTIGPLTVNWPENVKFRSGLGFRKCFSTAKDDDIVRVVVEWTYWVHRAHTREST